MNYLASKISITGRPRRLDRILTRASFWRAASIELYGTRPMPVPALPDVHNFYPSDHFGLLSVLDFQPRRVRSSCHCRLGTQHARERSRFRLLTEAAGIGCKRQHGRAGGAAGAAGRDGARGGHEAEAASAREAARCRGGGHAGARRERVLPLAGRLAETRRPLTLLGPRRARHRPRSAPGLLRAARQGALSSTPRFFVRFR